MRPRPAYPSPSDDTILKLATHSLLSLSIRVHVFCFAEADIRVYLRLLPAYGIRWSARVSPSRQHTGVWITPRHYSPNTTGAHAYDLMPQCGQPLRHCLGDALLEVQAARVVRAGVERIRHALRRKARGLD